MALYFGDSKVKINLGGVVYCLNLATGVQSVNIQQQLLTADGYILKDSQGRIIVTKATDIE